MPPVDSFSSSTNTPPFPLLLVRQRDLPDADATRRRLAAALLGYLAALVLLLTLAPFQFVRPDSPRVLLLGPAFDQAMNVLLFVPLGFLYLQTRRAGGRGGVLHALGAGALVSLGIETVQLFEPERYSSVSDVLANTLGAGLGASLQVRLSARLRLDAARVRRLALELPLMGLVYLLVPLLWLNAVGVAGSAWALPQLLLLGLFGGSLLAAVQREHFGRVGLVTPRGMALASGGWFLLGAFPALALRPLAVSAAALTVVGYVGVRARYAGGPAGAERRFEADALRRAAPFFAAYLLLLAVLPPEPLSAEWVVHWGLPGHSGASKLAMIRLLEAVAAFTLLGYLLAELRGRRELPYAAVAGPVALRAAGAVLLVEGLRAFQPGYGASMLGAALLLGAALYGAALYHLQRAHVRWLVMQEQTRRELAAEERLPALVGWARGGGAAVGAPHQRHSTPSTGSSGSAPMGRGKASSSAR